jgi:uncharacterized protein (DUF4415 family)
MSKGKRDSTVKAELAALAAKRDDEINVEDIPEVRDWSRAARGRFYRPIKRPISVRIDADVLAWFKSQGRKYQSRINEALRDYMQQHRAGARRAS